MLDEDGEEWNSIKSWIKTEIVKNPGASVEEIYRKVLPHVEEILLGELDFFLDEEKLKSYIRAGKKLWGPKASS
jgi:hypothetical protein